MSDLSLEALLADIRICRHCEAELPHGPRPVVQAGREARILVIGQAPGTKVHASGIPWDDASGERLREWMGMEAKGFLGSTVEMDLTLRTNDSANGCNVILDSIRAAKMAISKNDLNKSEIISAYAFKNPPKKMKIRDSIKAFEDNWMPINRPT